jgi:NADP-dependent aldehyde dehydrogenase
VTDSVRAACAAASGAADELAALDPTQRARLLRAAAAALRSNRDEIVPLADQETHLGPARLGGELDRTTGQLELFATVLEDGSFLEALVDPRDGARPDVRRVLHPVGPVAVFAASNFPLAFSVAGGDTASALAAGCPVVVKAHEGHPRLSALVGSILTDVLPAGVLGVVYGRAAGPALVEDPAIAAVGFTGSVAGGRYLFDLAQRRPDPIPFYGELGSINPVVVTPAAARSRGPEIATGYVGSVTLGSGQFCTKPGLLFLPADHGLAAPLQEAIATAPRGELLGDWIAEGFARRLDSVRGHTAVREIADGAATLLAVPASSFDPDLAEECFGPASLIVEYGSLDELAVALDRVAGSLTLTVHGELPEDDALARRLVAWGERHAGRIIWNGWPTGVAVTWAMHHGGPWPASTAPGHTSVGTTAIRRFLRPVAYQDLPDPLLPPALRETNPLNLTRRVAGHLSGPLWPPLRPPTSGRS